jgi:maleamate amidohydrolase
VASINELTQAFRSHDEPVVWVRQEFVPDLGDAFLEMRKQGMRATIAETGGCEVLAELDRQPPDKTVVKKRYSSFFGTDLDATLASLRPAAIIVSGINTKDTTSNVTGNRKGKRRSIFLDAAGL